MNIFLKLKINGMKPRKIISVSLRLIVAAILVFLFLAHRNKQAPVAPILPPQDNTTATQNIDKFILVGNKKDGSKKWEVKGKEAIFVSETLIELKNINAKAYGSNNVTIVADSGSVDHATNNIHLEKNVIATTDDGIRLSTDYADYSGKTEAINTEAPVLIEGKGVKTTGIGMQAVPSLEFARIKKAVVANVEPKTLITCDGPLDIEYKKNAAVFYNNVHVTDTQGELFADRVDALYDPNTKKIIQVFAVGKVKIIQGENITYCEEATYNTQDGKVIFRGQPKLVITPEEGKKQDENATGQK